MSIDTIFLTKSIPSNNVGGPPPPTTSNEAYLLALLDTQNGLSAALDALAARMAYADARETDDIKLSMAQIKGDYLRFAAMVTAYLSKSAVFKTMGTEQVTALRDIVNRIQGYTASKDRASAIVDSVTKLLSHWQGAPGGAGPAASPAAADIDIDPIAALDEKIV